MTIKTTKKIIKKSITPTTLTNRELQNVVGQLVLDIQADKNLTLEQKASATHHASAVHLRCTRAEIYAINSSHRGSAPANLATTMRMPVFVP